MRISDWSSDVCSSDLDFDTVDLRHQSVAFAAPRQMSWHEEQRQATTAGRRIGQPGEHEVNDVVSSIVIAAGNEQLGAADGVTTANQGLCACAHQTKIASEIGSASCRGSVWQYVSIPVDAGSFKHKKKTKSQMRHSQDKT